MKYLLFILLFAVSCTNHKQSKTTVEIPKPISDTMFQQMISELSNSTFTTFDKLFDTSQLAPYRYIGDFECISNHITNYSSPLPTKERLLLTPISMVYCFLMMKKSFSLLMIYK